MRILLAEDEIELAQAIQKGLAERGYAVDHTASGVEAQELAESEDYDAIILDVMLPGKSGVTVCRELRRAKRETPILMLTARAELEDKVEGLDAGADDYLTKPFAFAELVARVKAIVRRRYAKPTSRLEIGDLTIETAKRKVWRADKEIKLTPKEFAILELLALRAGEVVSRTDIMEHTWDYNFESMSNVVDVFVASIRRKIDKGQKSKLIQTVHGMGYALREEV